MSELATHDVKLVTQGARSTGARRSGRFLADIAAHIWDKSSVGTVGTLDLIVTKSPASRWRAAVSGTTPTIWEAKDAQIYPQLAPTIAELTLWGGSVVLVLPAQNPLREVGSTYWTTDLITGPSTLRPSAEDEFSTTEPVEHFPMWLERFGAYIAEELAGGSLRQERPRDVHAELRLLSDWARLPIEQLGELVGASRRTIYNWFAGKPIGDEAQARILRLRDLLTPVAETRDPSLVRSWLLHGDPSPATLAAQERWRELEHLVAVEVKPLQPATEIGEASEGRPAYVDSPGVLRAALLAFASPPARVRQPSGDWRPREVTGIALEETEDAE